MKYKYRLSLYFVQFIVAGLSSAAILSVIGLLANESVEKLTGGFFRIPFLIVIFSFINLSEYKNKYVETFEEYMCLNSFRFRGHRRPFSPNVRYEDIWYIEARRLPIIGVWGIRINAKYLPHKTTISFCFKNHKKLYAELCERVRYFKPDVRIDSYLTEYLDKQ